MRSVAVAFLFALSALTACDTEVTVDGFDETNEEDILLSDPDEPDRSLFAPTATVGDVARTACSTAAVKPLAKQLLAEVNCLRPGTLTSIAGMPGVTLGTGALPELNVGAANALRAATGGSAITISSSTRATVQQYVLYYWYTHGRCTSVVSLAARPGNSNHESGVAIDVPAYSSWRSRLTARGFAWLGSSDPVHFDYRGAGAVDLRPLAVKAFQRLWNRNHPNDRIAEDGVYGPATAARIDRSPAAGFAIGPSCGAPPPPPPAPSGKLTGVVYRGTDTSNRIAGATVRLSTGQTTTTSATGVYTITGVRAGDVTITASKTGFTPRSITRTVVANTENWGSIGLTSSARASACGDLTEVGACDGSIVTHCSGGEPVALDCAASGQTCGFDGEEGYFDCRSAQSFAHHGHAH